MSKPFLMTGKRRSPYLPVGPDCVFYHAYWSGTALDHSQYGHDGTVTFGNGSFGPLGLIFDGAATKVNVTMTDDLQFGTYDWGIFCWCNLTSLIRSQILLISKWGDEINKGDTALLEDRNRTPMEVIGADGYGGQYNYQLTGYVTSPGLNGWHMISYEVDRDVGGIVSLDGAILTYPFEHPNGPIDLTDQRQCDYFEIGGVRPGGPLTGTVGELFMFKNYGLYSGKTRAQIFNATKARYGL